MIFPQTNILKLYFHYKNANQILYNNYDPLMSNIVLRSYRYILLDVLSHWSKIIGGWYKTVIIPLTS
jgi:hypothetical protein